VAEDYVRPPLVAHEPPSPAAARWRFRVVVGLLFAVIVAGIATLLFTVILANNEGNPGLNPQGLAAHPARTTTSATVPPSAAAAIES
jgi:hypothetical protein